MIVLAEALWTSRTDIKIISIWITLKLLWCWYHLTSIDKPTSVIWFRALNSEFQSNLRAERHAEISSDGSSNWMQPILHFILALLESNCQLLIHEPRSLHVSRWHVTAAEQFSLSLDLPSSAESWHLPLAADAQNAAAGCRLRDGLDIQDAGYSYRQATTHNMKTGRRRRLL